LNFTPFAPGAVVEDIVRLPFVMLSKVQIPQAGFGTKVVDALSAANELSERATTTNVTGAVMARRVGRSIGIPPPGDVGRLCRLSHRLPWLSKGHVRALTSVPSSRACGQSEHGLGGFQPKLAHTLKQGSDRATEASDLCAANTKRAKARLKQVERAVTK
jgi:hypothetical protein